MKRKKSFKYIQAHTPTLGYQKNIKTLVESTVEVSEKPVENSTRVYLP